MPVKMEHWGSMIFVRVILVLLLGPLIKNVEIYLWVLSPCIFFPPSMFLILPTPRIPFAWVILKNKLRIFIIWVSHVLSSGGCVVTNAENLKPSLVFWQISFILGIGTIAPVIYYRSSINYRFVMNADRSSILRAWVQVLHVIF